MSRTVSDPNFYHPRDYFRSHGHAVVIGASIAGLLAARVLAPHFRRVTVIERDTLSDMAEPRRGVAQGRHVHTLLIRGEQLLSELFPDLVPTLIGRGAVPVTLGCDLRWYHFGRWKRHFSSSLTSIAVSRPCLELEIRRHVRHLPNLTLVDGTIVTRYLADWERARITGVCIRDRDSQMLEAPLHADLVVDASGRASQTPQRIAELGYQKPEDLLVNVDCCYATRIYERPPFAWDWKNMHVLERPSARRGGFISTVEGNRWMVTLIGFHGDHPSDNEAAFLEFARSLPVPDFHAAVTSARPLSRIARYAFPGSQRRYYERLARFPIGLIVLGDALCSLNPVYGQGMTVSALQAKMLGECLEDLKSRGTPYMDALTSNFRSRVAKVIDAPWQLATSEDMRFPQTPGHRSLGLRLMHWYMTKLHEAAGASALIAERFHRVSHMLAPRSSLFSGDVLMALVRAARKRKQPATGTCAPSPRETRQRGSRAA